MVFDVLKGIVLIVFTVIVFPVGFFAEAICTPIGGQKKQPLINDFISELWENSYKYQLYAVLIIKTKHQIMATVYKVEIVSHWVNYNPEDLRRKLEKLLLDEGGNEVSVTIERI